MNSSLPVLRIQTVDIEGIPQNFDDIVVQSKREVTPRANLSLVEWEKHIEHIKNLSELANKASEYGTKNNLTEGKTVIVPDLISSKNIDGSLSNVVTSPDTPKKKLLVLEKTGEKIQGLKVELQRQELQQSPINPTMTLPCDDQPATSMFPSASPTVCIVRGKVLLESESSKFPTCSPLKVPVFMSNDKPNIVVMEQKTATAEERDNELPKKKSPVNLNLKSTSCFDMNREQAVKAPPSGKPQLLTLQPMHKPETQTKLNTKLLTTQDMIAAKPPNILVYADSTTTRNNVIRTLGAILQKNTYTVYPFSRQQAYSRIWMDNTTLLVVCGSVNGSGVGSIFLDFFFKGGKVLCLCSDLLGSVLPTYHTAEVCFQSQRP